MLTSQTMDAARNHVGIDRHRKLVTSTSVSVGRCHEADVGVECFASAPSGEASTNDDVAKLQDSPGVERQNVERDLR